MTNTQFCLSIGIPTLAVLLGFPATLVQINSIHARIGDVGSPLRDFSMRLGRLGDRFDILIQKFDELNNRVSRVEDLLRH